MNIYTIEINEGQEKNVDVIKSSSPSEAEKQISKDLGDKFEERFGEELKVRGYQRATFDVQLDKNTISIDRTFLLKDNGEVEIVQLGYKTRLKGHSISTRLKKKVGGLAMSIHVPTPLIIFQKEIEASFNEGFLVKMGITAFLSTALMLAGITVQQVIMGFTLFFIIALLDAILGCLPNTVKENTDMKEHKIQAKFLMFVANFAGMTVLLAIHLFMINLVPDPGVLLYLPVNVHFIGIMYIISAYGYRIFHYLAVANKTKVPLPEFITKVGKKD